ncbi:hypothetical protein [Flavobacterium aquiphilum]|uniref:hypothetical protein n=1 Tax=Flavobacterium aquiphilum TaxID=3003261 RepID=UPI0024816120|nr:hypothetical protein [Flavobacterium aquiphilum]
MDISIAVILFQIGIFLIMTYAAYKGVWYLNILTLIIIVFTLANVNAFPLMAIQFFTIIISYTFCLNRINANKCVYILRKKNRIELILIILINLAIICLMIYGWTWFTIFYFKNYGDFTEEWFLQILGVISYIIMLGFALMISGLRYFQLEKTTKELFSSFQTK